MRRGHQKPATSRCKLKWLKWLQGLATSSNGAQATAPYSVLSARIGSMRLARCAGIRPAAADTSAISTVVDTAMTGSAAWMPYN
jgi:hypothetical protein